MSLKYIKSERGTNILVDGGYTSCTSVNAIIARKKYLVMCAL